MPTLIVSQYVLYELDIDTPSTATASHSGVTGRPQKPPIRESRRKQPPHASDAPPRYATTN
ncbi:hypothetical protein N7499_003099 [Penicillium canescens]|uniref:Uncharacterized protein n=1 Tax=Penicillium canescens TaxID=5083 RepID=A0AAD6IAT3_PENCN|nr:hypothetical protein N7460_007126 [Penicillium canescens]KAJ6093768.1 hypothetical protein N7499_003099 [Penicillium canescens]